MRLLLRLLPGQRRLEVALQPPAEIVAELAPVDHEPRASTLAEGAERDPLDVVTAAEPVLRVNVDGLHGARGDEVAQIGTAGPLEDRHLVSRDAIVLKDDEFGLRAIGAGALALDGLPREVLLVGADALVDDHRALVVASHYAASFR